MTGEHKKILVAGIGNPLMGDDGLSEHVIAKLKLHTWPENVTLVNIGCSVLNHSDCTDTARDSHGLSILDAIALARLKKGKPTQVIIYGIEPFDYNPGIGLSPAISSSVLILEQLVLDKIMGHL